MSVHCAHVVCVRTVISLLNSTGGSVVKMKLWVLTVRCDLNFEIAVSSLPCLRYRLLLWKPEFDPGTLHVRFVLDNMTLGQVLSGYFGFTLSFCF
jgi:hypothetical protein